MKLNIEFAEALDDSHDDMVVDQIRKNSQRLAEIWPKYLSLTGM